MVQAHAHAVQSSALLYFFFVGTAAILAVGGSKPTVTADASGRIGVEKQMQVPRAPEP